MNKNIDETRKLDLSTTEIQVNDNNHINPDTLFIRLLDIDVEPMSIDDDDSSHLQTKGSFIDTTGLVLSKNDVENLVKTLQDWLNN